jgi:hypothetical protein
LPARKTGPACLSGGPVSCLAARHPFLLPHSLQSAQPRRVPRLWLLVDRTDLVHRRNHTYYSTSMHELVVYVDPVGSSHHYRKMLYFRRPPLVPTVSRVPSEIRLFPTAHGQPSEIRLFPMAPQPPVENSSISDGWPTKPSEIRGGPLTTVVTPRDPPAAHTANAHTHRTHVLTPRRRRQGTRRRRHTCPDRRTPRRTARRRPDDRSQRAAAPTPAHLPRRPHSAPPPPRLKPPAPGFAHRRRPGLARAVVVRVMASLSFSFHYVNSFFNIIRL